MSNSSTNSNNYSDNDTNTNKTANATPLISLIRTVMTEGLSHRHSRGPTRHTNPHSSYIVSPHTCIWVTVCSVYW